MKPYAKIETLLNRDEKTFRVKEGEWRLPEFAYLSENTWIWTEKVDGTNIRVMWDEGSLGYAGKTDNASIPPFLLNHLRAILPIERFTNLYPDTPMCLYGEGYGAKIQKGGGKYIPNGVGFVLFDVLIDGWWLERPNVEDIAEKLGLQVVPIVGRGTPLEAVTLAKGGLRSRWGDFPAEGLVVKPEVGLLTRAGHRVIGKIKAKDFSVEQ